MSHPVYNLMVRSRLKKIRDTATPEQRAAIDSALSDRDNLAMVTEACRQACSGEGEGDLQSLLQWLLDNADSIIALIMKLLPLFV